MWQWREKWLYNHTRKMKLLYSQGKINRFRLSHNDLEECDLYFAHCFLSFALQFPHWKYRLLCCRCRSARICLLAFFCVQQCTLTWFRRDYFWFRVKRSSKMNIRTTFPLIFFFGIITIFDRRNTKKRRGLLKLKFINLCIEPGFFEQVCTYLAPIVRQTFFYWK